MDRRTPFRDGPEDCSETTTAQHIIYNTQGAVWNPPFCENFSAKTRPGTPLLLPRPPKKKHPQPTRERLLIESPSPVRCPRNRFPGPSPSVNPCIGPHAKDSHPKPASDCALTPSRARISSPLAIGREHDGLCSNTLPRRNATATCARTMGQDFRLLAPVRGLTRPPIPSSLPRALAKLPGNIPSRGH